MNAFPFHRFSLPYLVCVAATLVWTGCGKDTVTGPPPTPPLSFENFQAASVVVGQANMNSGSPNAGGSTGPMGLWTPYGAGAGSYYLADQLNNRVLGFSGVPTSNGTSAGFVVGQPDFTTSTAGLTASKVSSVNFVWSDGRRLAISDKDNRRVLIWDRIPTTNGAPASVVVGAPDFVTQGSGTAGAIGEPVGLASDGANLFVADRSYSRVLIYTPFPRKNGAAASGVLGQSDFTHVQYNDDNQDGTAGAPSARVMFLPAGLSISEGQLLVSDWGNNRILIFASQ